VHFVADFPRLCGADTMDILERDEHALVGRDIDAGDTGHMSLHVGEALSFADY
jgi:hypothetical protein